MNGTCRPVLGTRYQNKPSEPARNEPDEEDDDDISEIVARNELNDDRVGRCRPLDAERDDGPRCLPVTDEFKVFRSFDGRSLPLFNAHPGKEGACFVAIENTGDGEPAIHELGFERGGGTVAQRGNVQNTEEQERSVQEKGEENAQPEEVLCHRGFPQTVENGESAPPRFLSSGRKLPFPPESIPAPKAARRTMNIRYPRKTRTAIAPPAMTWDRSGRHSLRHRKQGTRGRQRHSAGRLRQIRPNFPGNSLSLKPVTGSGCFREKKRAGFVCAGNSSDLFFYLSSFELFHTYAAETSHASRFGEHSPALRRGSSVPCDLLPIPAADKGIKRSLYY